MAKTPKKRLDAQGLIKIVKDHPRIIPCGFAQFLDGLLLFPSVSQKLHDPKDPNFVQEVILILNKFGISLK